MNILEKITERTKERIEEEKKIVPLEEVRRQAEEKGIKDQIPAFEQALRAEGSVSYTHLTLPTKA